MVSRLFASVWCKPTRAAGVRAATLHWVQVCTHHTPRPAPAACSSMWQACLPLTYSLRYLFAVCMCRPQSWRARSPPATRLHSKTMWDVCVAFDSAAAVFRAGQTFTVYGVWLNLSPSRDSARTWRTRGRTGRRPPPPRSHRARCALCDREGFSRIGRSSREHHVP